MGARGFLRSSLGRAWRDTIELHWVRTEMTVATSVVAALILFLATGNHASWLAVFAAPIVLALTYLVFLTLNLCGWNRLWTSRWSVAPASTDVGPRLMLDLQPKDRAMRWDSPDIDCRVRCPHGRPSQHHAGGREARGKYWTMYPDLFEGAPPLTTGTYRVIWLEETRPGKRREVLTHRARVALPAPARPSPTKGSAEQHTGALDVGKE